MSAEKLNYRSPLVKRWSGICPSCPQTVVFPSPSIQFVDANATALRLNVLFRLTVEKRMQLLSLEINVVWNEEGKKGLPLKEAIVVHHTLTTITRL